MSHSLQPQHLSKAFKCAVCKHAGFTVQFPSLELVKSHLRINHRVTEEICILSSIILPAKCQQQVHQIASDAADDDDDLEDEDEDELCVLEEIAPPRFPSETVEEVEVEVLEEIPPASFRRKSRSRDNWRVTLLNKMREMRFLPTDQLAVQLRKAQEEMRKKRKEEEVLVSFMKNKKGGKENDTM